MRKLLFLLLVCLICVGCQDTQRGLSRELVDELWELGEGYATTFQMNVKLFWKSKKERQYYIVWRTSKDKMESYSGGADVLIIKKARWEKILKRR